MAARDDVRDGRERRDAAEDPGSDIGTPPEARVWPDVVLLALGALLVRVPAFLAPTNLGYDDGGYGLAAVAMRQGYAPFRDIFSSQGPLFLPLVHVADQLGFETLNAPRSLAVASGVVVTVAVYYIGTELLDRARALLAAGLTATSGVLAWTTGPLTSDGTMAAFATSAVAVGCAYRRRPSARKAIAVGLLIGAAISVKHLLAGSAVLIAWVMVLTAARAGPPRRRWDSVLVGGLAVAVFVLASIPWGENVIHDNVEYHLDKTSELRPAANLDKLVTTFARRDTMLVAVGATGAIATVLARRSRRRGRNDPSTVLTDDVVPNGLDRLIAGPRILWWWASLVTVVLVVQDPMFRNHLAALVPPLALLAARFRPPWIAVGCVAALAVGFQVTELRPLLLPGQYDGRAATITRHLDTLPEDAWVLSDDPGLVWRAGFATDPYFVDPSRLRFLPGQGPAVAIDEDRLVDAATNPQVCAVVVTSPKRFGSLHGLAARLAAADYEVVSDFGDGLGVYLRPCPPDRLD